MFVLRFLVIIKACSDFLQRPNNNKISPKMWTVKITRKRHENSSHDVLLVAGGFHESVVAVWAAVAPRLFGHVVAQHVTT